MRSARGAAGGAAGAACQAAANSHAATARPRDLALLALQALAGTYARPELTAQGPEFAGLRVDGPRAELTFRSAAGLHTADGLTASYFLLAGADRRFFPAQAKIDGDKVQLTSAEVSAPVAVRFAWDEVATPNLVNAQSLPAVPFRTDDWPLKP